MDLYEFKDHGKLELYERDNLLCHASAIMDNQYDWTTSWDDPPAPREHYMQKRVQDDNGNSVKVSIEAKTLPSGKKEAIGYHLTTDPDNYDAGEELQEFMDSLEQGEDHL